MICPIEDGKVLFPTSKGTIEIPTAPFLGTIGVALAAERRYSFVQGADFLGNTDLPLNGIGATIVMRANVPGGLISFGDAHAVAGRRRDLRGRDRVPGRRHRHRRAHRARTTRVRRRSRR